MDRDKSAAADVPVAAEPPAARVAPNPVDPAAQEAASTVDAEALLASTLEQAKTDNKRVMVHLGAPW
jgi:hypothetical protein